ncbi:MAG TPA: DUF6058 family natural product biosynthesis protein [Rheinheimera sp.]|uniref:DUF6058 family natural product biosynthesis protein n=1 Tax=Rheinheimera sp. TaxID=1869214 RepID=UPI002B471197|nr:DUF6058 family natural product biosynthesis protein [Rheinheimera sp.]HJS15895.1 DUF6058 family natural product biosynthesis protein [Rheinheimera sp.]
MLLKTYLQKHFVHKPAFASLLGITVERLDQLIAAKAVPEPTYVCDGNTISSAVFGVIETEESIYGDYFRPECSRWVKIADQAAPGQERDAVFSVLSHELKLGLQDYFKEPEMIEKKIQDFLPYFLNGTFGLCIADPSTGTSIARKEVLQLKLTELTENGSNPSPEAISKSELLQLIDDYALSSMPFSPAEYERSSRKRLVDDLRPAVAKA